MKQLTLTARAFHRILKPCPEPVEWVSRTIADPSAQLRAGLAGLPTIGSAHPSASSFDKLRTASGQALAEALQYRPRGQT